MSLRNALRANTSDCHALVDDIFARFDLSHKDQYCAFLCAHARVLAAMEEALEDADIQRVLPDWSARRRRDFLMADLAALDVAVPPRLPISPLSGRSALWGAVYVLEGSKLGGAMLAKSVPAELPSSYLSPQGVKGSMKLFMDSLDAAGDIDIDLATQAARAVFAHFRKAAELELELAVS